MIEFSFGQLTAIYLGLAWSDFFLTWKSVEQIKRFNSKVKLSDYELNPIVNKLMSFFSEEDGFIIGLITLTIIVIIISWVITFLFMKELKTPIVFFLIGMYFVLIITHIMNINKIEKKLRENPDFTFCGDCWGQGFKLKDSD